MSTWNETGPSSDAQPLSEPLPLSVSEGFPPQSVPQVFLESCCKLSAQAMKAVGMPYITEVCQKNQISISLAPQADSNQQKNVEIYLRGAYSVLKALQAHFVGIINTKCTTEDIPVAGGKEERHRHGTSTSTHSLPTSSSIQINQITYRILELTAEDRLKQIEKTCNVCVKPLSMSSDSTVTLAVQGKSHDCYLEEGLKGLTEECIKITKMATEIREQIPSPLVPVIKKIDWASFKIIGTLEDAGCTLVGLKTDVNVARKFILQIVRSQNSLNPLSIHDSIFIMGSRVVIVKNGDITKEQVDIIVNAANSRLEHTGGVARAICEAAGGRTFQNECHALRRTHGHIQEGDAVVTGAGSLTMEKIIHAVAPKWHSQKHQRNGITLLHQLCYNCLKLTDENKAVSVAIPAIGSGHFGIPREVCAEALVASTDKFFKDSPASCIKCVILIDMDDSAVAAFVSQAKRFFSKC
jgi:O-acetyl-ADP-ribose deacetylase (regulator of RNase III)